MSIGAETPGPQLPPQSSPPPPHFLSSMPWFSILPCANTQGKSLSLYNLHREQRGEPSSWPPPLSPHNIERIGRQTGGCVGFLRCHGYRPNVNTTKKSLGTARAQTQTTSPGRFFLLPSPSSHVRRVLRWTELNNNPAHNWRQTVDTFEWASWTLYWLWRSQT